MSHRSRSLARTLAACVAIASVLGFVLHRGAVEAPEQEMGFRAPWQSTTTTARGKKGKRAIVSAAAVDEALRATGLTYLEQMLAERDSVLLRWPERIDQPIRVWIADGAGLAGWQPDFPEHVRRAFVDWERVGVPIRFAFVTDSAAAEVRVRWTDRLPKEASGVTKWHADGRRWMESGEIDLAMIASDGALQDDRGVRAIALHEIGHMLGLGHSTNRDDVMAPWVAVDALSAADTATVRLLYTLPPGRVSRAIAG